MSKDKRDVVIEFNSIHDYQEHLEKNFLQDFETYYKWAVENKIMDKRLKALLPQLEQMLPKSVLIKWIMMRK